MAERIRLVAGDITKLAVGAVVTSANSALMGGGGVDGAIHRAAGPELMEVCRQIGYCPEGEARITPAFHLSTARYIIHAVGPIYVNGQAGEADVLSSAYQASLRLAEANQVTTIAFPCIATGAFEYPHEEACAIAVDAVTGWLEQHDLPQTVTFCCLEPEDIDCYRERLKLEPVAVSG